MKFRSQQPIGEGYGLPSIEVLERRGVEEYGGCSGEDKGGFPVIFFHPHLTSPFEGEEL